MEFIVTTQVPVPAQGAPFHPVKTFPDVGVAVNVTVVSGVNGAEQVDPQLMPVGELVTEPEPDVATVNVYCGGGAGPKVAVTDWLEFRVKLQLPLPLHAPPQPLRIDPDAGVAARFTTVPEA